MLYSYSATLVSVVDGDTYDVSLDLGLRIFTTTRLRLYGFNCPERFTDDGKKATKFVQEWFDSAAKITVNTIKDKQEKYGRYLAVITNDKGESLGDSLAAAGLAKQMTY